MLAHALLLVPLAQAASFDAAYTWTIDPGEEAVHVEARFDLTPAEDDPELPEWIELALPERVTFVWLEDALLLDPLRAADLDGAALPIEEVDGTHWRLRRGSTSSFRLTYSVGLFHREHPDVGPRHAYEFPYLAEDHGMLMSYCLAIHPTNVEFDSARVAVAAPPAWSTLAPWPPSGPADEYAPSTLASLRNDIVAVGAWETAVVNVDSYAAVVAVAPGQEGLLETVSDPLERIVRHELALFDRPLTGTYLFLFGRPDQPGGFAGSPKTSSMTLMVGRGMAAAANEFVPHLVAHEFFHTWAASVANLPDELRWLNEGVTDYYAYRVISEIGLVPWSRFTRTIGEKLTAVESNELHGRLSLTEVGGPVFFEDGAAREYCYDAGFAMGVFLDRELRSRGVRGGLDTLLRSFLNDDAWQSPDTLPTLDAFLATLVRHTDEAFAADVRDLVAEAVEPDFSLILEATGMPVQRDPHVPSRITLPEDWVWDPDPTATD